MADEAETKNWLHFCSHLPGHHAEDGMVQTNRDFLDCNRMNLRLVNSVGALLNIVTL